MRLICVSKQAPGKLIVSLLEMKDLFIQITVFVEIQQSHNHSNLMTIRKGQYYVYGMWQYKVIGTKKWFLGRNAKIENISMKKKSLANSSPWNQTYKLNVVYIII